MKHLLWLLLLIPFTTSAHQGRTDEHGCHMGMTYHCHSGDYEGMAWSSEYHFHGWRLQQNGESLEPIVVVEPEPDPPSDPIGDIVGDWNLSITLGEQQTDALLELGDRATLTGDFGSYNVPVTVSGDNASFDLDDPDVGQIAFDLTASGDSVQGTVRAQGQTGQVTGNRVTESEPEPDPPIEPDPPVEPPTSGDTVFFDAVPDGSKWRNSKGTIEVRDGYVRIHTVSDDAWLDSPIGLPDPAGSNRLRQMCVEWEQRMPFEAGQYGTSNKFLRIWDVTGGADIGIRISWTQMHLTYDGGGPSWGIDHKDTHPTPNQWNDMKICLDADRGTIQARLNGELIHDRSDWSPGSRGMHPRLVGWDFSGSVEDGAAFGPTHVDIRNYRVYRP